MLVVVSYDPLYFYSVTCDIFFSISNFIELSHLSLFFFLMSLAKGLSILFIFSKNQLLVPLIFTIILSFIAALIFMILFAFYYLEALFVLFYLVILHGRLVVYLKFFFFFCGKIVLL